MILRRQREPRRPLRTTVSSRYASLRRPGGRGLHGSGVGDRRPPGRVADRIDAARRVMAREGPANTRITPSPGSGASRAPRGRVGRRCAAFRPERKPPKRRNIVHAAHAWGAREHVEPGSAARRAPRHLRVTPWRRSEGCRGPSRCRPERCPTRARRSWRRDLERLPSRPRTPYGRPVPGEGHEARVAALAAVLAADVRTQFVPGCAKTLREDFSRTIRSTRRV
jgi:hypothetical protein